MGSYYSNPYGYQTPIGQGMENIAQAMYKTAVLRRQMDLDKQKLDFERQKYEELELPLKQAQAMKSQAEMLKAQAEAEASNADVQRMQAMPDTVAQAFAGITAPQLGQIRGFQNSGSWGTAPTMEGLDQIGGGNWMPRHANPEVMQNVRIADMATALPGKKPDDYAKAMGDISRLFFTQGAQSGAVPVPDIQRRGMAEAAAGGKALFGNPNTEGLVGDLFTGAVLNQDNPLANSQVAADRALAGERHATAGLRREQVNTEKSQQRKYDAEAANERANPGGKKGDMTAAQQMSREEKNQRIITARRKLAALVEADRAEPDEAGRKFFAKGQDSKDKDFQDALAMAQEKMIGVEDPHHQDWVNYLSGQGARTGTGYTPAGKKPAVVRQQAADPVAAFASIKDAEKAQAAGKIKAGDIIMIGGKKARVD